MPQSASRKVSPCFRLNRIRRQPLPNSPKLWYINNVMMIQSSASIKGGVCTLHVLELAKVIRVNESSIPAQDLLAPLRERAPFRRLEDGAQFTQRRSLMPLKAGQYIKHFKYGLGTIISRDENRTVVDFDTAGMKLFVTPMATFEIAEGQAPVRKKRATSRRRKTPTATVAAAASSAAVSN